MLNEVLKRAPSLQRQKQTQTHTDYRKPGWPQCITGAAVICVTYLGQQACLSLHKQPTNRGTLMQYSSKVYSNTFPGRTSLRAVVKHESHIAGKIMWMDVDKRQHSVSMPVLVSSLTLQESYLYVHNVIYHTASAHKQIDLCSNRPDNESTCCLGPFLNILIPGDTQKQTCFVSEPQGETVLFPGRCFYPLCALYQHLMCWNPRVFLWQMMVLSSQLAAPGFLK